MDDYLDMFGRFLPICSNKKEQDEILARAYGIYRTSKEYIAYEKALSQAIREYREMKERRKIREKKIHLF
jgi:hypothetical protein